MDAVDVTGQACPNDRCEHWLYEHDAGGCIHCPCPIVGQSDSTGRGIQMGVLSGGLFGPLSLREEAEEWERVAASQQAARERGEPVIHWTPPTGPPRPEEPDAWPEWEVALHGSVEAAREDLTRRQADWHVKYG